MDEREVKIWELLMAFEEAGHRFSQIMSRLGDKIDALDYRDANEGESQVDRAEQLAIELLGLSEEEVETYKNHRGA